MPKPARGLVRDTEGHTSTVSIASTAHAIAPTASTIAAAPTVLPEVAATEFGAAATPAGLAAAKAAGAGCHAGQPSRHLLVRLLHRKITTFNSFSTTVVPPKLNSGTNLK